MKLISRIPLRLAAVFLMVQIVLVLIFHTLILLNLISLKVVWGGRIESRDQLLVLEGVSFAVNIFLFWIIGQRSGHFHKRWSDQSLRVALLIMTFLFLFNTLGNIVAVHPFEKYFFGTLTLISSILCLRLAIKERPEQESING